MYIGFRNITFDDVYVCTVDRKIFVVNKFSSVPYDDENFNIK